MQNHESQPIQNQPVAMRILLVLCLIVAVLLIGGVIYHYNTSSPPESLLHSPTIR